MTRQIKKSLNTVLARWYFFTAATVLAVGHTTPDLSTATSDAASVFFVVVTVYAMMRHFMVRCYPTGAVANLSYGRGWITPTTMSMVAQAGPTSVGPVSVDAGSGIPVWAIASEHTTSCDSSTSCQRRLPQWLQSKSKSAQNSRSPNSTATAVAVKNRCTVLVLQDIVIALLQIQQPGFASRNSIRCNNTHLKRVFCCLVPRIQWWHGRELLRKRRVSPYRPVMRIPFVLPPMASHPLMAVKSCMIRRLSEWLQSQPKIRDPPTQ